MTAARSHLSLVHSSADVIPLPRLRRIEHNALRHAVLREAASGVILSDEHGVTINKQPVSRDTREAVRSLVEAGCIDWFGAPGSDEPGGHIGWITTTGAAQLAEWDRPRPSGGDAA